MCQCFYHIAKGQMKKIEHHYNYGYEYALLHIERQVFDGEAFDERRTAWCYAAGVWSERVHTGTKLICSTKLR